MPNYAVSVKVTRDSTERFARVTGVHETNRERKLNIIIEPGLRQRFALRVQSSDDSFFDARDLGADAEIDVAVVALAVHNSYLAHMPPAQGCCARIPR